MAILKILTIPDPILRKISEPVKMVDDGIRAIMDDMLETCYHDDGVGLAANQVGILKRIIVMDLKNDDEVKRPEGFYPLFIANPEIIEASEEMVEAAEACLSVPAQRIVVARAKSVTIKYLDYNNNQQKLSADGWLARAIGHEIDHLNGKTLLDYLSPLKKNVAMRKIAKLK